MSNPRNKISYRKGSEGPRHDPYSFDEITFEGRRGKTVGHFGLAAWVRHNGVIVADDNTAYDVWITLTGLPPHKAIELYHKRPWRKHATKCDGKDFTEESGYPGESFTICAKCGDIVDSHMNWSEIE